MSSERIRTTLGAILPLQYGKAKTADAGYERQGTAIFGSSGVFGYHDKALTQGPAIVVGRKGAAGLVHYSPNPCWPTDTTYFTTGNHSLHLPFFKYLLESLQLDRLDRSTAIPSLSRDDYNPIPCEFPEDIDGQVAVCGQIELQFSQLDAGIAALKRAQANLKRYRASVLQAACEGRLVPTEHALAQAEGRDYETGEQLLQRILTERRQSWNGKGKFKEPSAPLTDFDLDLPDGWAISCIDQIGAVGTGATPKRGTARFYEGGTIPWVARGALNETYVDSAKEFVTTVAIKQTNLSLYPPGTLLVAMYGEGKTRGKCSELRISATTNQAIAAIEVTEKLRPYVKVCLLGQYERIRLAASGGVQPNLNLSLVREIQIMFPPLAEQVRIVAEVERRLSVVDQLEKTITANLARATRLRQAILKKAFTPIENSPGGTHCR